MHIDRARDPSSQRLRAPSATFDEHLYETLRQTPWWAASIALHIVVGGLVMLLTPPPAPLTAPPAMAFIDTTQDYPDIEPDDPPQVKPEEPRPERATVPEDQPELKDPTEDTEVETDDDVEFDDVRDADSDTWSGAFDGPHSNDLIGVAGNAGSLFGERGGKGGNENKRGKGGGMEEAKVAGLEWLARHQSPGGAWDGDGFEARCKRNKCGGAGSPLHDVGLTGLSLLTFLGAGETHRTPDYGRVVREGLKYLKRSQDAEGVFGSRTSQHWVYDHAVATLAMCEAYGMTQSPLFKTSAQKGIDAIHRAQNPYMAWRYGIRPQDNDTSVTGWMVMALKSAKAAGLDVDPATFDGALAWLDKVTDPEYGRAGYTQRGNGPARPQELMDRFPSDKSESLTAVALVTRIFAGADEKDPYVRQGAELLTKSLPVWDEAAGTIDHYYWYYGTIAMFQVGGEGWKAWEKAMIPAIVETQHTDPQDDRYGSWDPIGPWGGDGGRIYSTAVLTMCVQIHRRYGRVFGVK